MRRILFIFLILITMNACQNQPVEPRASWDKVLAEKMPLLGHRNWIVITDMAYPLQSAEGITTLYADEPYTDVLRKVKELVDAAPHVISHVYHDAELRFLKDDDVPGIEALCKEMEQVCGEKTEYVAHENLLERMDEASRLYNVVIIKTPLTMPYTSTFFELDCGYWNSAKQEKLDKAMQK